MNIGIVASSNGSVFKELFGVLQTIAPNKYKFYIVLDRNTDLIGFCQNNNISVKLIEDNTNTTFCKKVDEYFSDKKINTVLLFFVRVVTRDIFDNYYTINIHPSLLPAYRGLKAVKSAFDDGCKFLGCTLHKVDKNIDAGKILIQTVKTISEDDTIESLQKVSFLQKTLLLLIFFSYVEAGFSLETSLEQGIKSSTVHPFFVMDTYLEEFKKIQMRENCKVLDV